MRGELLSDRNEYQVWIVWKLIGDRPTLIAIDMSETRADCHVAYDKACDTYAGKPLSEYFVEKSLLNHLYGQSINGTEASFKISRILQRK